MIDFKNILAVGATNRNLGKTEFICRLLKRFQDKSIIAIKIKTIYPGDENHHGKGSKFESDFLVRKESKEKGLDDSKRFLFAGAESVYYIKAHIQHLDTAINEVRSKFSDSQLFIAESNSLLKYFQPGGFIMIKGADPKIYKPSSIELMHMADKIVYSDGASFDFTPEEINIHVDKSGWKI